MILYLLFALASVMHFLYQALARWKEERRIAIAQENARQEEKKYLADLDVLCDIAGNAGEIISLAFLPDGKRMACACRDDATIRLWDVESATGSLTTLKNDDASVNAIAVSKDGKWIVGGGANGKVAIWSTSLPNERMGESWQEKHRLRITSLDVSPDSLRVASGSDDGRIMVWRIDSEPVLRREVSCSRNQDTSPVSCLKFSPGGGRIVCGYSRSGYYTIQVWHSWTGQELARIPTDGQLTRSITWSSDGRRIFGGAPHGSIRCYDVAARRCIANREDSQSDVITSLCVSNTGHFLISVSASARVIDIWDIRDMSTGFKRLHSYRRSDALSIAPISSNQSHILHGGKDRKIYRRRLTKSTSMEMTNFLHSLSLSSTPVDPLTYVSNPVYELWMNGKLEEAESALTGEITQESLQDFVQYSRANRSLVRARLQKWDEALEDAEAAMSNKTQISDIARCVARCGQGNPEGASMMYNVVHCNGGDTLKSFIEQFKVELGNCGPQHSGLLQSIDTCFSAQMATWNAENCIRDSNHEGALQYLSSAPDLSAYPRTPEADIIFLIFGWNVYDLHFMILQLKFQAYAAPGRANGVEEALTFLEEHINQKVDGKSSINEEMDARKGVFGLLIERIGDESICRVSYDDAVTWYTLALELLPFPVILDLSKRCLETCDAAYQASASQKDDTTTVYIEMLSGQSQRVRLLLKRSKARAEKRLWKDALSDADEVIRLDPECPWGDERRRAARLEHKGKIDGSDKVLSAVESAISRLPPGKDSREEVIDKAISEVAKFCPLVLIDVKEGVLCNEYQRKEAFKKDPIYHSLPAATTPLEREQIVREVRQFFRYVMFSHRWGSREPLFKEVSALKSVYEVDSSVPLEKLRNFCQMVKDDREGYRWAWSDTCCIDKEVEFIYKRSIRSMYDWYRLSALTLVLLPDELPVELEKSEWMTRAWTLQELLSPKVIRFYNRQWKLYRGDAMANHKGSPYIMRELAKALRIEPHDLLDFSPEALDVRKKLHLASSRHATVEEDIAYSLFGIFESDLTPEPRNPSSALGLLLQEIVNRSQDTAVIDWTGPASDFNSCLPAGIAVYSQPPYRIPLIPEDDMNKQISELERSLIKQEGINFDQKLAHLDQLQFADRRLRLPCITFPVAVKKCGTDMGQHHAHEYVAESSTLGKVEFTTKDNLQPDLVLVYPWIRDLRTQAHPPEEAADRDTSTSRLLVHLEQPFRALLLRKKDQIHEEYQRVATDGDIQVPRRKLTSLKDVNAVRLIVL